MDLEMPLYFCNSCNRYISYVVGGNRCGLCQSQFVRPWATLQQHEQYQHGNHLGWRQQREPYTEYSPIEHPAFLGRPAQTEYRAITVIPHTAPLPDNAIVFRCGPRERGVPPTPSSNFNNFSIFLFLARFMAPTRPSPPYFTSDGRIVDHTEAGIIFDGAVDHRRNTLLVKDLQPEEENEETVCAICLERQSDKAAFLPNCRHFFHQTCIERWLQQKNTCPLCFTTVA